MNNIHRWASLAVDRALRRALLNLSESFRQAAEKKPVPARTSTGKGPQPRKEENRGGA